MRRMDEQARLGVIRGAEERQTRIFGAVRTDPSGVGLGEHVIDRESRLNSRAGGLIFLIISEDAARPWVGRQVADELLTPVVSEASDCGGAVGQGRVIGNSNRIRNSGRFAPPLGDNTDLRWDRELWHSGHRRSGKDTDPADLFEAHEGGGSSGARAND